jgi:RluA family pseudouridine synthase
MRDVGSHKAHEMANICERAREYPGKLNLFWYTFSAMTEPNPTAPTFDVLQQTPDWIAINKPVGIASIAERDPSVVCVQRALEVQVGRLWVVHRLDKEVSGVLIFAKNAPTHRSLSMAFEHRLSQKEYTAMVFGEAPKEMTIDQPLREFGSGRMGVHAAGKASQTQFVRQNTVAANDLHYSLLRVRPLTGRRHQIRVHLYCIGHAIVGDPLYGHSDRKYPRLMLHASSLEIAIPEMPPISLHAPAPDFASMLLAQ